MDIMKYIPVLDASDSLSALIIKELPPDAAILLGEYGSISPLSAIGTVRKAHKGRIFLELITKNKNRDLVISFMLSAASSGFDGIILASGKFEKKKGMARPVYDLDPSQMLKAAVRLKSEGRLPGSFTLSVRSAVTEGAALERARYFLQNGADFLAVTGIVPDELKDRSILIEEIR